MGLVQIKRQIILATASLLLSGSAFGWAELGHQVVADVAEQILAKDAKTMAAIRSIIGLEPLAVAAAWADKVKSDDRFNQLAVYHYITVYRDPKKKTAQNALTVLKKYPALLTDDKISRETKMMALRYLVHVMGDMHQPLHAGNEFDRGGNACNINWQPESDMPSKGTNLHVVWDDHLVDYISAKFERESSVRYKYFGYKQVSNILIERHKDLIRSASRKVDIDGWIADTIHLRESSVYPDRLADDARPYCAQGRKINPQDIPLLGPDYAEAKSAIVEKRLVLGGIHLAALLKEAFANATPRGPSEAEILNPLLLENEPTFTIKNTF